MATPAEPGTLHTGEAAPAQTGVKPTKRGLFGGRGAPRETAAPAGTGTGRGSRLGGVNTAAWTGLLLSQLLTVAAFFITLGGLSALQRRANNLLLGPQQQAIYQQTFVAGNVIPYPNDGKKQFGLQWWLLWLEVAIFVTILALMAIPRLLLRLKPVAMAFLVYVFVLITLQIDSLLYFKRSTAGTVLYGDRRIKATLAGTMLAAICNALSLVFLGLLHDKTHDHHTGDGIGARAGGKRVEPVSSGPAMV